MRFFFFPPPKKEKNITDYICFGKNSRRFEVIKAGLNGLNIAGDGDSRGAYCTAVNRAPATARLGDVSPATDVSGVAPGRFVPALRLCVRRLQMWLIVSRKINFLNCKCTPLPFVPSRTIRETGKWVKRDRATWRPGSGSNVGRKAGRCLFYVG